MASKSTASAVACTWQRDVTEHDDVWRDAGGDDCPCSRPVRKTQRVAIRPSPRFPPVFPSLAPAASAQNGTSQTISRI